MATQKKIGRKYLSGDGLFATVRSVFEKVPDDRQQASVSIPIADALMSGFVPAE